MSDSAHCTHSAIKALRVAITSRLGLAHRTPAYIVLRIKPRRAAARGYYAWFTTTQLETAFSDLSETHRSTLVDIAQVDVVRFCDRPLALRLYGTDKTTVRFRSAVLSISLATIQKVLKENNDTPNISFLVYVQDSFLYCVLLCVACVRRFVTRWGGPGAIEAWLLLPSVPWHCWLGHLTRKNRPQNDP